MTPERSRKIERADKFRIPWGKYKGQRLDHIPSKYLRWLAECCTNDRIATKADIVWQCREDNSEHFEEKDLI